MSQKLKIIVIVSVVIATGVGAWFYLRKPSREARLATMQKLVVESGPFMVAIPATGSVQPENKVVIMPPVPGRIEQVLIEEGQSVKKGQILAWMSSTDRAALMDAAKTGSQEESATWSNVYKPTPILAPAAGMIISKTAVNGQTVSSTTAIFELSDQLIARALVDETDIGQIRLGQEAQVKVDAYRDNPFSAHVSHISHQSTLSNNVNTYEVEVRSKAMPETIRAGMTATISFVILKKDSAVQIPSWLAQGSQNAEVELTVQSGTGDPSKRIVKVGRSNGEKIEVLENLAAQDIVLFKPLKLPDQKNGNPLGFMGGGAKKK